MKKNLKIPVSFKETEEFIYDHIKSKFNFSSYIKELVVQDMNKIDNNQNKKGFSTEKKKVNSNNFDF